MIDKRFWKSIAVLAVWVVQLIPLYFVVGWVNFRFGWRISYDLAFVLTMIVAITIVGNMHADRPTKDTDPGDGKSG